MRSGTRCDQAAENGPGIGTIDLDGSGSCNSGGGGQGFGAYHNTVSLKAASGDGGADAGIPGSDVPTPYAIVPRCGDERETTLSASHEFIETATDPNVGVNDIAYYMNNPLWAFAGGEVGDVCVDFGGTGGDLYLESGFTVQRSWSNAAAKASHNPCVPEVASEVYFNVAPHGGDDQVRLKVGESKTIQLDAFSDGPMPADWKVSAVDFATLQGRTANLSFAFNKTNAHNGSHINLTVKLESRPTSGYAQYGIVSKLAGTKNTRFWPAVVVAQ